MPITTTDLQLKKSQRLTDTDDGGGLMTAQQVIDGEANNLFPDIGRIDRVAGRVNLRKVFGHVDTPDTDVLINGHLIVSQEPTDPRVHLVMFETGEPADERGGARDFVESYVLQGPTSPLRLYDTQQDGQRTLLCFAEVAAVIPDIGEVLCLSIEAAGFPATQQFVRITTAERRTERFTYEDGSTKVRVDDVASGWGNGYGEYAGCDSATVRGCNVIAKFFGHVREGDEVLAGNRDDRDGCPLNLDAGALGWAHGDGTGARLVMEKIHKADSEALDYPLWPQGRAEN